MQLDTLTRTRQRLFVTCFGVQLLIIFPIILAGRLYIDDLGRSAEGYLSWSAVGRPLADALFYFANLGAPAVNVFPLYQIVAAGLIALASVMLGEIFRLERPLGVAICTLPLGGQPYFLENYSYAFDSLTMTAGLICAVAASYSVLATPRVWTAIASSLLILASLCLYQQTVTAFFLIVGIVLAIRLALHERAFPLLASSFLASSIAVLFYMLLVGIPAEEYAAQSSNLWSFSNLIRGVSENVAKYWMTLHYHWGESVVGISALVIIMVGATLAIRSYSTCKAKFKDNVVRILVGVILALTVIFSLGVTLLVENPHMPPRFFIGVGVILTLYNLIVFTNTEETIRRRSHGFVLALLCRVPVVVLAYAFIVVAFSYGRASASQADFEMSLLTRLVHEIDTSVVSPDVESVSIVGVIPMSPGLSNAVKKFPAIKELVPRYLSNDWWWGHKQLNHFGLPLKKGPPSREISSLIKESGLRAVFTGNDYELYKHQDVLIVRFRHNQGASN